jgi:hypothetical protein
MTTTMTRGFGDCIRPVLLCCALYVLAMCTVAGGQTPTGLGHSAEEFLRPVVSQRQFTDLIRPLELSREQRLIVELVYEDYRDAIDLAKREKDREADAKGRRIVADALSGRRVVAQDELRHYRMEVLKVYRSLPATATELADRLLADVRSVVTVDQRPRLDEQVIAFRRTLHLHPRHLGRRDYEYAGEGVDVLLLVEDAREDGRELADIPVAALQPILREYELELDALLRSTASAYYEIGIDARIARISRDERAVREAERRMLEQWQMLHELNRRVAERIGDLAMHQVGEAAAHQWRRRFDREVFAWMFTPTRPDRIYEWMKGRLPDDERLAAAQSILSAYQDERWPLLREAADIMIRARSEFETIVYSMMDPSDLRGTPRSLYRELLLNSGRLASVESHAVADLESLLSDEERVQMRRETRSR